MNRREFLGVTALAATSAPTTSGSTGISQDAAAEVVHEFVEPARGDLVAAGGTPEDAIPKLEAALVQLKREVD